MVSKIQINLFEPKTTPKSQLLHQNSITMKCNNLWFILTTFFFTIYVNAQTSVSGIVNDSQGNLPSATIYLEDQEFSTFSDLDGSFILEEIPDGSYNLIVDYIGYELLIVPIVVESQTPLNLGILQVQSSPQANELQEVVITGGVYKASQARAMTMKKESNTVTEVLSADAIGKLPDRNAADAVQRMQGVAIERDMGEGRFVTVRGTPIQWTSSTLNGNRMPSASGDNVHRGIQMDIFPAEMIQYVRLSKALTPDLDGDAIGGNVDFITRSSPNKEIISLSAAGGYVNMSQSPTYNASAVYGNKITDKWKFITSAVIYNRSTALDQVRGIYNYGLEDQTQSYSITQLQLRDYEADRRTIGLNLGTDYEFNLNNKVYFKGFYSQYLDKQSVRETYFNFDSKNVLLQARHADYITDLYSFQLGGSHKFSSKLELNWSAQKGRSSFKMDSPDNLGKDERGYPIVNFTQSMDYSNLASDGRKYLQSDSPDGTGDSNDKILPYNLNNLDATQLRLNQVILIKNRNSETDLRAQFDFKYKPTSSLEIKFGSKFLNKDKVVDSHTFVWMPMANLGVPDTSPVFLSQLETEGFPFNGGFMNPLGNPYDAVLINQITNGQIDQLYNPEIQEQLQLMQVSGENTPSNIASSYRGTENVWAAYAMATWKINDDMQLLGGIRNEYNDVTFYGKRTVSNPDNTTTVEDIEENNTYNVVLPMLNLKWNLNQDNILRAAYTRSFSRPDFNHLNPGTVINDIALTITQGNTQLNPTFSHNFDLMFERYFGKLDMISGGIFYKKISDMIYTDQSLVQLNGQTYSFTSPKNLEDASVFGVEIGLSKRFDMLPGFLKNFGFEGNYSFIDSKMNMPVYKDGVQSGTLETTIPNQAKHIFNAILFYETEKFMARIAGNFKGDYVSEVRASAGPEHYQHFDNNFTVDFSTSYSISKKIRIFAELNNLFNEPNRYYHGNDKNRLENLSYAGIRGQIGLNINL